MKAHWMFACVLLAGCAQVDPPPSSAWPRLTLDQPPRANLVDACVEDGEIERDYFPQKTSFRHSAQLQVSYHGHYKLLRFAATVGNPEPMHFALVQCGAPHPRNLPAHTRVVEVPVKRLATANESIYGALADLDAVDVLVGVPNFSGVTVPEVHAHIERGAVAEMYGWGHSSIEPALALNPDVYLTFYSAYPEFQMHPTLWEVGVQAMPQADHLEATPLGRAEWIKFLALLLNREARAETVFLDIEARYEALKARVADVRERPRVITGYASQRDTWDTQGGRNFRTRLIDDAGGYFAMSADLPTANGWLMLPFERVYAAAGQAPVWYGGLQGIANYAQLADSNPHYVWLRSVRERAVHALDKGYRGEWAFPSVDQGMTRPHWSLEDAIRILHPDRLPSGEFHFARSLQ